MILRQSHGAQPIHVRPSKLSSVACSTSTSTCSRTERPLSGKLRRRLPRGPSTTRSSSAFLLRTSDLTEKLSSSSVIFAELPPLSLSWTSASLSCAHRPVSPLAADTLVCALCAGRLSSPASSIVAPPRLALGGSAPSTRLWLLASRLRRCSVDSLRACVSQSTIGSRRKTCAGRGVRVRMRARARA